MLGEPVTFTATVTAGGDPVAAGSVAFNIDGGSTILSVDLTALGTATFPTTEVAAGSHTITARFTGTANHAISEGSVAHEVRVVADAGGPYTVAEGASLTLDGSGSSPGATYGWDLDGDGGFDDALGLSPTLTWAQLEALGIDDGPSDHPGALRVTSGLVTQDASSRLTVENTAPASVVTGDLTATVGVPFTVKVGAEDPSSADMAAQFTYTVDWGDGSPTLTVDGPADPPVTHTYTTAGDFNASFTTTDKDGGEGGPTAVTVLAVVAPPSPSPTPTGSPTSTPTGSPSPSPTPTGSPTSGPTESPAATPTVTPAPTATTSAGGDSLASTGADLGPGLAPLAVAFLIVGGTVLAASRRRRETGGPHE